jgi:hypothetical protein
MRNPGTRRGIEGVFATASEGGDLGALQRPARPAGESMREMIGRESIDDPRIIGRESELACIEARLERTADRSSVPLIQG